MLICYSYNILRYCLSLNLWLKGNVQHTYKGKPKYTSICQIHISRQPLNRRATSPITIEIEHKPSSFHWLNLIVDILTRATLRHQKAGWWHSLRFLLYFRSVTQCGLPSSKSLIDSTVTSFNTIFSPYTKASPQIVRHKLSGLIHSLEIFDFMEIIRMVL